MTRRRPSTGTRRDVLSAWRGPSSHAEWWFGSLRSRRAGLCEWRRLIVDGQGILLRYTLAAERSQCDELQARQHTNRSSAVGAFLSAAVVDISSVVRRFCRLRVVLGSRKGFRETGRAGGSSKGEPGLWRLGDTARLRNGLFDDRLSSKPADAWSSILDAGARQTSQSTGSNKRIHSSSGQSGGVHVNDDCER